MPNESSTSEPREWVVVMHARSAVRLRGDAMVAIEANPDSTAPVTALRLRNAFMTLDDKLVVRGLIAEGRGQARTPEEALELLAPRAAPLLQVTSTAANASVDEPEHLLIYAPPTAELEGRFIEQRPAGTSAPAVTIRSVTLNDLAPVFGQLLDHDDEERIQRAIAHFRKRCARSIPSTAS